MPLVSAAAQKRCVKKAGTRMDVCRFVTAHRFCCPCAPLYAARKGMCARETFVGFPLRVQSKAANGGPDFCKAKISRHQKRATLKGWLSFGAPSGIRTPDTLLKRQVLYLLS